MGKINGVESQFPIINLRFVPDFCVESIRMRTNIVIDDDLMNRVLKLTGIRTKREAVEMGLKALLKLKKQESIRNFRGKLDWEGDLDELRADD